MTFSLDGAGIHEACAFFRDNPECAFNFLSDVACVDWYPSEPRFEVVYHLLSLSKKERVRLKCAEQQQCGAESLLSVWPGANYFEREVFDLFGIRFTGHPYMRRILMPEDWEGYRCARTIRWRAIARRYGTFDAHTLLEPGQDRAMILNMGPQHPSTHGVLRVLLEIDGETVVRMMPDIGFLPHRDRKTCEAKFYQQVLPLTNHIDYLCSLRSKDSPRGCPR